MAALFWRDARLQSIEDFLIILESMVGSNIFVDFEIIMCKLIGVSSPVLLDSKLAEQSLVNCLFGIPPITIKKETLVEYVISEAG